MSLRLYPGTPVPGRLVRSNDRFFYGGMALLIATIVFVGFARTYYLATYFNAPPLNPLRIVHGALFSSWILLFMVQTTLIATNRRELHRRLGVAGAMLAIAMVVIGVSLAIETARDGRAPLGLEPRVFLIIPMFDMLVFAPLVAAGVYFRRVAETHKRLMLLATISLLAAALARFTTALAAAGPLFFFGAVDLLVLAGPVYDFATRGRVHPTYLGRFVNRGIAAAAALAKRHRRLARTGRLPRRSIAPSMHSPHGSKAWNRRKSAGLGFDRAPSNRSPLQGSTVKGRDPRVPVSRSIVRAAYLLPHCNRSFRCHASSTPKSP